MTTVLGGKRPEEPVDAKFLDFSDTLWGLVELCWGVYFGSTDRPAAP